MEFFNQSINLIQGLYSKAGYFTGICYVILIHLYSGSTRTESYFFGKTNYIMILLYKNYITHHEGQNGHSVALAMWYLCVCGPYLISCSHALTGARAKQHFPLKITEVTWAAINVSISSNKICFCNRRGPGSMWKKVLIFPKLGRVY